MSWLIMLALIAGGGYFFYSEQVKQKTPDKIATDTGQMNIEEIKKEPKKEEQEGTETEELLKKFDFSDTFESWDALDAALSDDGSYQLDKYPDEALYLVFAGKQDDGQILAIFSDKEEDKN